MNQIIAVILSLLIIPIFIKRKFDTGICLLITGVISAIIGGLNITQIISCFIDIFLVPKTLQALIVVLEVSILCGLLNSYGFIDKIGTSIKKVIKNPKIVMAVFPAIIGLMQVPGGAAISAPFAKNMGKEIGLSSSECSSVNVIFRHSNMFILPFASSIILVTTTVGSISINQMLTMTIPFAIYMYTTAYFVYIKKLPIKVDTSNREKADVKTFAQLLFYLSPIYSVVILNNVFNIPLYIAVFICIIYVAIIAKGQNFIANCKKSFNYKIPLMLIGVYFFQNVIKSFNSMMKIFSSVFQGSSTIMILISISMFAIVLGLVAGLSYVPLGVVLPIIISMNLPFNLLCGYTFFAYVWSAFGYLYSPLHLCQLLSDKCLECEYMESLKVNLRLAPFLIPAPFILFYVYSNFVFI